MVLTQFGKRIKIFRSDNGTEFTSKDFEEYFTSVGIIHEYSCPYTPQKNGVAERKNRYFLEVTRSLLLEMNVPKRFWSEAVMTAAHLINRMNSFYMALEVLLGRL